MSGQQTSKDLITVLKSFIADRLNLSEDQADEKDIIDDIKKGIIFKGTNLWVLIFAIFVASVGLNVNSTAVIIGAMLISPLMGPIMGVGLGVGIMDSELIIKSMKNLMIAVAISVMTSTFYFFITPLSDAQSELLARTTPTLWDVLIALFGGLAGIVAATRKEKSNVIPGVAIATALMPPLCTAGFGLASGNLSYFFGAFYLFFINSVFISFSTFLIVRFLKFQRKAFLDHAREVKVRRYIALFVVATILPSTYTGYKVVRRSIFERQAALFIKNELTSDSRQVINRELDFEKLEISIAVVGEPITEEHLSFVQKKLPQYYLDSVKIRITQGVAGQSGMDLSVLSQNLRAGIFDDLYQRNERVLKQQDSVIQALDRELIFRRANDSLAYLIAPEIKVLNPDVSTLGLSKVMITEMDSLHVNGVTLAFITFKKNQSRESIQKLSDWLKARTKADSLRVIAY